MTWQLRKPARLTRCPKCGQHILTAVTDGIICRADPGYLTLNAEIAARLDGREIYDIIVQDWPQHMYLRFRELHHVKAGRHHAVIAGHKCPPGPFPPHPADTGETELIVPLNDPGKLREIDEIPF